MNPLHPDLPTMAEYASQYSDVTFTTNGTLLSKRIDEVVEMPLSELNCSIHSPDPNLHAEIMSGADLHKVLASLRLIAENASYPVVVKTVVMSKNIDSIYELPHLLSEYGVENLNLYPIVGLTDFARAQRLPDKGESSYREFYQTMSQICGENGTKLGLINEAFYWDECYAPWFDGMISIDGTVAPCCILMDTAIGDAHDFREVWKGSKMREWRRRLLTGSPLSRLCQDVCKKHLGNHTRFFGYELICGVCGKVFESNCMTYYCDRC